MIKHPPAARLAAGAACLLLAAGPAIAHQGHGAAPLHMHAADALGLLALAALGGLAVWLWHRGQR